MIVFLVRKNSEDRFLMHQLSAKAVDHADRSGTICVEQRRKLVHDRQVLVYQKTLVNDIDLFASKKQTSVIKLKLLRRTYQRVVALFLKIITEKVRIPSEWGGL